MDFDFIIVGGGSAGCVLANRLSAKGDRVLLLEAGGEARALPYDLPFIAAKLFEFKANNWQFESTPQRHLNNRKIPFPRGRMLGGSFIFNGAQYIRGNEYDYALWRQMGNIGWSYDDVMPYFRKSEQYAGAADEYHGHQGPLPVGKPPIINGLSKVFLEAAVQAGFPMNNDFNGARQEGFGIYDFNVADGRRMTTARTFLKPVRHRANLKVEVNARTRRVVLEGKRAVAVEYEKGGKLILARASREIVLSAGSINTPKLLLLSGIGGVDKLASHGIAVKHMLPGVGENLQEHVNVPVAYQSTQPVTLASITRVDRLAVAMAEAVLFKRGQIAQSPLEAGGFFSLDSHAPAPEFQCVFVPYFPGSGVKLQMPWADQSAGHSYFMALWLNRPKSRGTITLQSADPDDAPVLDPNLMSEEEDRVKTREAVRFARHIFEQPAFAPYRGQELVPGPSVTSDESIDEFIRQTAGIGHHTCGTAKMGNDPMAVVDDELRVHGIAGLRVADASIMPTMVSGNTNAPTIMIAEKAADMMLAN